jgi:hypothetical protein
MATFGADHLEALGAQQVRRPFHWHPVAGHALSLAAELENRQGLVGAHGDRYEHGRYE